MILLLTLLHTLLHTTILPLSHAFLLAAAPDDPTQQPLNVISKVVAAIGAGGVMWNLGHMAISTFRHQRANNTGELVTDVGSAGVRALICVGVLAGGTIINWLSTTGASSNIPVPGH